MLDFFSEVWTPSRAQTKNQNKVKLTDEEKAIKKEEIKRNREAKTLATNAAKLTRLKEKREQRREAKNKLMKTILEESDSISTENPNNADSSGHNDVVKLAKASP